MAATDHDYPDLVAEVPPRGVARFALRRKYGNHVGVSEFLEPVAVAQHLPQAKPELAFLVLVGDAFDLGDEDGAVCRLREVEVQFLWLRRAWFDSGVAQGQREFVLCVCVSLETSLDQAGVDRERFPCG